MRTLFNAKSNRRAAMALLAGAISLGAVASAAADPGYRFHDPAPAHTVVVVERPHFRGPPAPVVIQYVRPVAPYGWRHGRRFARWEADRRYSAMAWSHRGPGHDDRRMPPVEARYDYR